MDSERHAAKVALVTGAGSGVGQATAIRLAAEGATVVVNDIDPDAAARTVSMLDGNRAHLAVAADVSDPAAVAGMFAAVEASAGRVDVVVCNAAVSRTPGDARDLKEQRALERFERRARGETVTVHVDHVADMGDDGWARMIEINLNGVFHCCRAALQSMRRTETAGSIVCVASIAAVSGVGPAHYAAAKGGVVGFARSLAREVASRGIRVNVMAPGPIDTPMMRSVPAASGADIASSIPLGRVGRPEEAAAAISFLASDEASFITGALLEVNGGLHIG